MIKRLGFAFSFASIITLGIFIMMVFLLAQEQQLVPGDSKSRPIIFLREFKEDPIRLKDRNPVKPEPAKPAPNMPQHAITDQISEGPAVISREITDIGEQESSGSARHLLPMYSPMPVYPPIARRLRLEGYVIVSFTVSGNGTVKNPSVVEAKPEGYFEKSAIAAILKSRFSPTLVSGKPVDTKKVLRKYVFRSDM